MLLANNIIHNSYMLVRVVTEKQTTKMLYYTCCTMVPWISFWRWGFQSNTLQVKPFLTAITHDHVGVITASLENLLLLVKFDKPLQIQKEESTLSCCDVFKYYYRSSIQQGIQIIVMKRLWQVWKCVKFAYLLLKAIAT